MRKRVVSNSRKRPQVSRAELQKKLSALRKIGAVSKKLNLNTVKITNYRVRQIRALDDVLTGKAEFVKLPKTDREAYARTTAARKFGSGLIVPKASPLQQTDVVEMGGKKLLRIRTPLKKGEISPIIIAPIMTTEIVLPYGVSDMISLAEAIQADSGLPEEILEMHPHDRYAFSVFGHTSKIGFPTKETLVDHILINYKHLFNGQSNEQAVMHFSLVNYGAGTSTGNVNPPDMGIEIPEEIAGPKYYSGKAEGRNPRINQKGRTDDWYNARKAQQQANRKKDRIAKMKKFNPEKYEAQIAAPARARAKKSYDNRMEKKKSDDFKNASFDT